MKKKKTTKKKKLVKQQCRIQWIVQGDRCTNYFHSSIKAKRHLNRINLLYNGAGDRITDGEGIIQEFISFYKNLMGSKTVTPKPDCNVISKGICLNEAQAIALSSSVTREEIKTAVFSMDDNKAPGPDGFNMSFYKSAWSIIGDEVSQAILDFFRTGKLLGMINSTSISLIPKVKCPKTPSDFRPIACCNCLYKIISKILANRIKSVMGFLINEAQSAFVKGRQISSNILMAHEIVRSYGRKHNSPRIMMSIDIKKAFDTISWNFLRDMLASLGFPDTFTNWIMMCITSPKYSISLNGTLHGYFKGEKGLRQGDPISPYLFTLGMEFLSRKLDMLKGDRSFKFQSEIYWTSNYILPVRVLQKIDQMCRDFLWGKTDQKHKIPLVSWDKACLNKRLGGLGIYSATIWNLATMLRLIWHIHINKESLWIKWIHSAYLRNDDIWHVQAKNWDSWMWKKILKIRDKAVSCCGGLNNLLLLIQSCSDNSRIQISALYNALSPNSSVVPWHRTVWETTNFPSHSFICWLAIQDRLLTIDRLIKRGLMNTNNCCLCSGSENRNHLFFECCYSREVWLKIMDWLRFKWQSCDWNQLVIWYCDRLKGNGFKQRIKRMALTTAVYSIWRERNFRIFRQKARSADQLFKDIKFSVFSFVLNGSFKAEDREWIISL
ncbi:uncharacterized protein LOC109828236 [Asparagus officinalis]|uniref:uncharacterized protein LOC109828236 n=1 Tax=Asparagus officinalis TaxID=4686 RepID=UPI00098DF699|nr:uncharacterized protein LOC109828236 [Asparagus officinalis]